MTVANLSDFCTPEQLAGTEEIQSAFTAALADTEVTELVLPAGSRLMAEGSYIDISARKNLTIDFNGATIFKSGSGTAVLFLDRFNGLGYGAGVQDLTIKNGTLEGSFSANRPVQLLGSNHGQRIRIQNFDFVACIVQGYHIFELDGCDDVVIEDCNFYGYMPNGTATPRSEAINLDVSQVGAGATVAPYGDGLPCINFTLRRTNFLPWTDPATDTTYPAPIPMGAHDSREGAMLDNIIVESVRVVDPPVDNLGGDPELDTEKPYIRGLFHLPSARNVNISADVQATDGSIRVVQVQSAMAGVLASSDPNATSTRGNFTVPNVAENIIVNVTVNGLSGNQSVNPLVYVNGVDNGYAQDVDIHLTTDAAVQGVYLRKVQNATVTGTLTDVETPVELNTVSNVTVGPGTIQSEAVYSSVIVFSGTSTTVTAFGIQWSGYRSLASGTIPTDFVIDSSASGSSSLDRRLVLTVWDKNYNRKGQIGKLISADVSLRHNAPGSCEFTIAANNRRVADLSAPGARVTADYYPDGTSLPIRLSGMVSNIHGEGRAEQATRTFTVMDDWNLLNTVLAFPNPLGTDDQQGDTSAYYTLKGYTAEGLVRNVVRANAINRLGMNLKILPNGARGDIIPVMTFRMHPIADRIFPKVDQAGIGVRIVQVGAQRELQIYSPTTYPRVLSEDSGVIQGGSFDVATQTVTRVLVAAGGEGRQRVFKHWVGDAEAELGTVLEQFVDARDIPKFIDSDDDGAEDDPNPNLESDMHDRAIAALTEGHRKASMDLTLVERGSFRFGKTFNLGDRISVQMNQGPVITDLVREVQITAGVGEAITVTPIVGDWAEADKSMIKIIAQLAKSLRESQRLT